MLDESVVFVDIETNGLGYKRGRVIEVAAIRVEASWSEIQSYSSIVNPQTQIPAFITKLTGITSKDLDSAPCFADIADDLYRFLEGAIFIAHSVRFDYSFLKQEFARVGKKFNPRMLCTVKLSQALYPQQQSHKLDSIIGRCDIKVKNRHRAYDDAYAVLRFVEHARKKFSDNVVDSAITSQLKKPTLPKGLSQTVVDSLPQDHGVYIFEDENGSPLYVGKSVNIKKRILSHFRNDHAVATEFKISQLISRINVRPTGGELEALLLESKLIKEMQPLYNRRLRATKTMTLARQSKDSRGYINISIDDISKIQPGSTEDILAVYSNKGRAKESLNQAIKDSRLCPKLMGFEKNSGSCFLFQLRKCDGACIGQEAPQRYNARIIDYFAEKRIESWPFSSPILIEEKNPVGPDTPKAIVVDQWCVIADITQDEECSPSISLYDRAFDIDTYKILSAHLKNKMHLLKIRPISTSQLQIMANS